MLFGQWLGRDHFSGALILTRSSEDVLGISISVLDSGFTVLGDSIAVLDL